VCGRVGRTETWSVSPTVDMLPFGVTIPATVPQKSEIPEGLMNYLVYLPKYLLPFCNYDSKLFVNIQN